MDHDIEGRSTVDAGDDLSFRAFSSAKQRYFAGLHAETELRRLERLFREPPAMRPGCERRDENGSQGQAPR